MKTYIAATMALGAWIAWKGDANGWQIAATAALSPVLLPVALGHEAHCWYEEYGSR